MSQKIEYVFSTISPWAYIGHAFFVDIARRHNTSIEFIPVNLLDLFSRTGGLPLPQRAPERQNYRWYELQRWREVRKIDLNLSPRHWPFKFHLLDKTITAATSLNHDPADFIHKAMLGIWSLDLDLSQPENIVNVADQAGIPGAACLEKAQSEEIETLYEKNTERAISKGCFGSPTYWLNGEMFFGQDRLEQLEDALKTGRAPYRIPQE